MDASIVKLDKNRNLVSYSKNLAEARYYLTPIEQKLVWAMCSLVNSKDDEDFKTYKIEVQSLAEYIGIDKKSALRELDRVTDNLMSRVLRIPIDNGDKLLKIHWVSHCLMSDKYVEFSFHPKMKPYLLKLRKHFASHRFSAIVYFRGSYTIRLYQLLKVYLYENKYKCSVQELREILEVGGAYKEFKEFKRNVLVPAKKEFERKNKEAGGYMSDITFDLETIRTGRKITDLVFHIRKQSYQERLPIELPEAEVKEVSVDPAREALEKYGIKGEITQKYLDQQDEAEILRCVALLEQAIGAGKVKSSQSGYLLKLLEARAGQESEAERQEQKKTAKKAEQLRKEAEEEKQKEQIIQLSSQFFREERKRWIASLSEQEQLEKFKEAQQGLGFVPDSMKNLESPLIMDFVMSQIDNYEARKEAYIDNHLSS